MDMDKDLASAMVSQRCNCYDSALESAKKVVTKENLPPDQIEAARNIVKSLGAWYFRQHCMEKIMECYDLLQRLPRVDPEKTPDKSDSFRKSDVSSREISTTLNPDVQEIFEALGQLEENRNKDEAELLREAVSLLILKYSMEESIRGKVLSKAEKLFSE
ncbi:hypothetical protein [Desulfonatronospira sp.]|uniref:hypothetical protein n=1 Tax=Desulfonatronospira sp. TaxID=1962951 RepID=UPI0025C384A0|nr:hypothetical protein [Desulfonatronospira sp.]